MFSSLALSAVLLTPAAPKPKDASPNPTGPAPQVLYFAALNVTAAANVPAGNAADRPINLITYTNRKVEYQTVVNGQKVKKEMDQRVPTSKPLGGRDETFTTADGSKLTSEEAIRRLKGGAVALVSTDGKPVDSGWIRVLPKDTILIHSAEITGTVSTTVGRRLMTPAPRLALLTPEADGTIKLAASDPAANNAAGNNVVVANGNGAVIQIQIGANGAVLPAQPVNATEATAKPKADPATNNPSPPRAKSPAARVLLSRCARR